MRTIADSIHPASKATLATEIQYNLALSSAGVIEKIERRFNPQQGQVFNPSDTCTIVLPGIDFMDIPNSYLEFRVAATGAGVAFPTSVNDLIYKTILRTGDGTVLSQNDHVNLMNRALSNYVIDSSAKQGSLQITDGFGTLAERQTFATGRAYAISLTNINSFFRSQSRHFPLAASQGLTLEIEFASANVGLTVTSGVGNYQITQLGLVTNLVRYDAPTTQAILKHWSEKGIKLGFTQLSYAPFTSSNQVEVLNIPVQKKSIRSIYIFPRVITTINDPTADSFASTAQTLQSVQFQMGDTQSVRFVNAASIHKELQSAFNYQVIGSTNWANWQASAFVIALNTEALSSVLSGMDASISNMVLSVLIEYSSAISQVRYDFLIENDAVAEITPAGVMIHS